MVKQSAAVCNSLNLVNKRKVVGNVADLAAFKACEACFLARFHTMQYRPARHVCYKRKEKSTPVGMDDGSLSGALASTKGLEEAGCMYCMLLPCLPCVIDCHRRATYCKRFGQEFGLFSCCNKILIRWNPVLMHMPVKSESCLECCAVVVFHTQTQMLFC